VGVYDVSLHNLRREKPKDGDVNISRSSIFGNPYQITSNCPRDEAIRLFGIYAREKVRVDPAFANAVRGLKGKRLFCWCSPLACHGEVLELLCEELNK
jgi:hypothetical protein